MEEETAANEIQSESKWRYLRPRSLNYYLKTTSARRKIGSIATKGFFQIKEFLNKEIPIPSPGEISDSFAGLLSKPFIEGAGKKENTRQSIQKPHKDDLNALVRKSNEVLAEATTVFPITLFPDTISLDRKKLVVTIRSFFMTSKVLTIQVEEILNLAVNVGPLFGSLHIAIRGLTSEDHFDINYLRRKDAIHLKHMIEGYIIALNEKVRTEHLSKEELIKTLVKLGSDSNPEKL